MGLIASVHQLGHYWRGSQLSGSCPPCAWPPQQPSPQGGLTFEEEVGVVLEGAVGLLHEGEVGVLGTAGARGRAPVLRDELASELEHQAEDAMDDVHDWCCLLSQEAPSRG